MLSRKHTLSLLFFVLVLLNSSAKAIEPNPTEIALMKELLRLEVDLHESSEIASSSLISAANFPTGRPEGLEKSLSLQSFSAPYDLYVWQQDGSLFGEVVPTSSAKVYVCSSSWILIQAINNLISAFNSVRFIGADGVTVCEDHSQSKIFQISQWEFLYDTLVDFNLPFNMVENRNAELAVPINGGVSGSSADSELGLISQNLNISIPLINLDTIEGKRKVWIELIYNGNLADGALSWKLGDAGYKE